MSPLRFPLPKPPQPLPHRPNLPQMRLLDELRLSIQVQNAIAIPMVARARDQILRMQIRRIARGGVVRVVADVEPDVDVAVDKGEPVGREVEVAVVVVEVEIGGAGDGVEAALGEGPGAPLLRVVDLQNAGDEREAGGGRDLVGALFGAGTVEVAAGSGVGRIGVEGLVLRAEAGCAVDRGAGADWEEGLFDVLGVVAEVGPSLAVAVFAEYGVDGCDVGGGIYVGDVGAEVEEVLGTVRRIPVKLLPCIGWIVHWPTDWECNRHGEVSVVRQRLEAEQCLKCVDRSGVVCSHQGIELIDDIVDTRDAVLGSELLDWSIPLRIGEHGMNYGATGYTAVQQVSVLLYRKCSLGTCQASSVQDPRSVRRR